MALYFFHTESDVRHSDEEGVELASMDAARQQAAMTIAGMLCDGAAKFWGSKPWAMTVTDAAGLTLFTVEVHGQDAPSVTPPRPV